MSQVVIIPGLTNDDKVPGDYNYLNYGVARASVGAFPVRCNLLGNIIPPVIGAVVRSGGTTGPVVSFTGTPTASADYVVEITTGGAVATAVFRWSDDGGETWTETVTTAATVALNNGVTAAFAVGTHVDGEIHSMSTTRYGTADLNVLYDVYSPEQSEELFYPGSELDVMCKAALEIEGVSLRAMAVECASGAAKATLTITLGGVWTTNGETGVRIFGTTYRVAANAVDSLSTVASRLADELNADDDAMFTAEASGAAITLTMKTPGVRGNTLSVWKVLDLAPAGLTMALAGGTALTGGGVPFSTGSGTDDVEDALAALLPETVPLYDFYGVAQNDSVNAALIEAQLDTKSGPLVAQYEQAVFAFNGAQANAISLAQTTLNHVLCMFLCDEQGESYPPAVAAQFAAIRSITEGVNPNPDYDGMVLPTMVPRSKEAKAIEPNHPKLKAMLNAGVTPLVTDDGKLKICRAITTKCLKNAAPFWGSIEPGDATVPMRGSRIISSYWAEFKAANPSSGPDPDIANGEKNAPEGVGTPSRWQMKLTTILTEMEEARWIYQVAQNLPSAYWDDSAERIMAVVPLKPRPINHQVGNELRQLA